MRQIAMYFIVTIVMFATQVASSRSEDLTRSNWETYFRSLEEQGRPFGVNRFYFPTLKRDQIGTIDEQYFIVFQKMGPKEALVHTKSSSGVPSEGPFLFRNFEQIADLANEGMFYIDSRSKDYKSVQLFSTTEIYEYRTAIGGVNNVLVVEPVSIVLPTKPSEISPEKRKWTTKAGGHSVEATFVEANRGNVTLKKEDEKTVEVLLITLSEDDIEYVRGLLKRDSDHARKVRSKSRRR